MAELAWHGAPVFPPRHIYWPSEEQSLLAGKEGLPKEEESFASLPVAAGRNLLLEGYDPEEVLGCRAGDTVPVLLPMHPSG